VVKEVAVAALTPQAALQIDIFNPGLPRIDFALPGKLGNVS